MVANQQRILGVIQLSDVIKPGVAERFAERVGVVFGQGVRSVFPEFGTSQRLGFQ